MKAVTRQRVAELSRDALDDCKDELSALLHVGKQNIEKRYQKAFGQRLLDEFGNFFVDECPIACPPLKKYGTKAPKCDFAVVSGDDDALIGIEIKCVQVPPRKYKNPQHYIGQVFYDALKLSGEIPRTKKSKRLFERLSTNKKTLRFDQSFLVLLAFGEESFVPASSIDFARHAYNVLFWNWADTLKYYSNRTDLHEGGRKLLALEGTKGPLDWWTCSPTKRPLLSTVKGKKFSYVAVVHELDQSQRQPN